MPKSKNRVGIIIKDIKMKPSKILKSKTLVSLTKFEMVKIVGGGNGSGNENQNTSTSTSESNSGQSRTQLFQMLSQIMK